MKSNEAMINFDMQKLLYRKKSVLSQKYIQNRGSVILKAKNLC